MQENGKEPGEPPCWYKAVRGPYIVTKKTLSIKIALLKIMIAI